MLGEALHHRGAGVDVGPAASVGYRDVIFGTDWSEQAPEIDLLDQHFKIDRLVFPKGNWIVIGMRLLHPLNDIGRLLLWRRVVDGFKVLKPAAAIFGDDINGEPAGFTTIGDQGLSRSEFALREPVLFQQITPATSRDVEIKC